MMIRISKTLSICHDDISSVRLNVDGNRNEIKLKDGSTIHQIPEYKQSVCQCYDKLIVDINNACEAENEKSK